MAHVAAHLSVSALEQQYRSCTDVTAARHLQTIWLLAKGHHIAEVAATVAYARRWVERLLARYNAQGPQALSSDLLVGPRMAISLGIEFHHGVLDGAVEVFRSREGLMGEVMPLQVAPDSFNVVQLGSVFRQPLDPEPVGALGERRTGRLAGVDRAVIEHKHDRLEHSAELGAIAPIDLLQERDEV